MEDFGDFRDLDVIGNGEKNTEYQEIRECFARLLFHFTKWTKHSVATKSYVVLQQHKYFVITGHEIIENVN